MDMKGLTSLTNSSYRLFQKSVNNSLYEISDMRLEKDYIMYITSDLESDNLTTCLGFSYNTISGAKAAYDINDNAIGFTINYHERIFVSHPITSIFTKGDNYYLEI